jgi:hypothetical protein
MGWKLVPTALVIASYLILPERWFAMQALYSDTAIASTPRPYLDSEITMFVGRNGSRSLAQVAAQQKKE